MSLKDQEFQKVYREHADYVFALARRLSKSQADAEDLFQEVFLKAFRFFDSFRGGSMKSWLRSIVVTTNVSRHRGLKNQPTVALDDHEGWRESVPDPSPSPQERVESAERWEKAKGALEKLSPEARTILVLREIEDLDYQQISEILGVPKGTVRSRLARGREALRKVLETSDG